MKEYLTPTVISALVAAVVSVLISLINNQYVTKIEEKKQRDRIRTFRYQTLYEFSQNWLGSPKEFVDPNSAINVINRNLSKQKIYLFDRDQYFKIRTLFDESYREELDALFLHSYNTFDKMKDYEEICESPTTTQEEKSQYRYWDNQFYKEATNIHERLQELLQQQIIDLL